MRIAVTIGKLADGSFVPLALPDRDVQLQKSLVKEIILAGGKTALGSKGKKTQLAEILYFDSAAKRKRF